MFTTHVKYYNATGRTEPEYRTISSAPLPLLNVQGDLFQEDKFENWTDRYGFTFLDFCGPFFILESPQSKNSYILIQDVDSYTRPIPSFYLKQWISMEHSQGFFEPSDEIPFDWYSNACQIGTKLQPLISTDVRLYGIGCQGKCICAGN